MMQKRIVVSLMLISFLVVLSASSALANTVTIESKNSLRCDGGVLNVTADVTADSVSAIEVIVEVSAGVNGGFFDALNVSWDPGFTALTDRFIDVSKVDGVSPDTIRFAALRLNADAALPAGSHVIAQIDFNTTDVCEDVVTLDGGTWEVPIPNNPPLQVQTQFVDAATLALLPAAVTAGAVTIVNSVPSIAAINDTSIHWGNTLVLSAGATDADTANGCELLSYSKASGPADLNVDAATGVITYTPPFGDVCTHTVEVQVTDKCGASDTVAFEICVTNDAPTIACPDGFIMGLDETTSAQVTGSQPDQLGAPALLYSLVGVTFDPAFSNGSAGLSAIVDPGTGEVTLTSDNEKLAEGVYTVTVTVTDGSNLCDPCNPRNADTCSFEVEVIGLQVYIESVDSVIQGKFEQVGVFAHDFNYPVAGFDLLVSYDNSALSLQGVEKGAFLDEANWEYFQYRFGPFGNCGNGCPSGMVRLVALAEINDGNNSTKIFVNSDLMSDELASLNFLVSNDRTLECQFVPIKFYWLDCGDNAFSSVSGDSLFVSRRVYDYNGSVYTRIDDTLASFPGISGIGDSCLTMGMKGKVPIRNLDLWNGGIRIICGDEIDDRGDLNLNGIAYEIADAVMYTNYFIEGLSAFDDHADASIAASDANADGITLSVSDLVYLIRVVVGDALPFPKAEAVHSNFSADDGVIRVPNATLGAAYLVLRGQKAPELLTNDGVLKYQYDSDNDVTNVLVTIPYENAHGPVKGFSGDILRFDGTENDVVTHEFASIEAGSVIGDMVPTSFKLDQNYPNPFNPTTTISFALPQAGDWRLTIYNITGQVVETFEGTADGAQYTSVNWDASNVASGVYFYRVTSGSYTATKKAVLLK